MEIGKWQADKATVFVFLLIASMLIGSQLTPAFPDPDSFYHAQMAEIIRDQGFIHQFPWLEFTAWKDAYVDHHLLYHILLIPFVTFFDPIVGMKISAILFGLLAFFALFAFLRFLKAPRPEFLTLATALSFAFFHRLSLPRAPSLSIIFLLLGLWAMMTERRLILFLTSFVFVWLYGGYPVIAVAWVAWFFGTIMAQRILQEKKSLRPIFKTGAAMLSGLVAGFVVNPYWPENIGFDILQIIKIGLLNQAAHIAVGTEWYPISLPDFLAHNLVVLAVFGLSISLLIPAAAVKQQTLTQSDVARPFALLFLALGFTLMTFKSNRYIEYAVPFLILTAGSLLPYSFKVLRDHLRFPSFRHLVPVALLVTLVLAFNIVRQSRPSGTFQLARYAPAAEWIKEHVPPGEVVFHNAWDSSIILWYLDDTHRYLVGLDPRFMYDLYPEKYEVLLGLVRGDDADVSQIQSIFGSSTVVYDARLPAKFAENLETSGLYNQTVETEWVSVYRLKAL